jgi:hypothetical protein
MESSTRGSLMGTAGTLQCRPCSLRTLKLCTQLCSVYTNGVRCNSAAFKVLTSVVPCHAVATIAEYTYTVLTQ